MVTKIIQGYPYNHILKVSGHYLHFLPSYKGRKNKPLTGERRAESREQRERRRIIVHTLPKSHLLGKGCAIYTLPTSHLLLPSYKGRKIKPLTGERRVERESKEREDKGYNTLLAKISSAGQGLCNSYLYKLKLCIYPAIF